MIDPNEKIRFVELKAYNPAWKQLFMTASEEIKPVLKENCVEIHHIGSTAIPNIYAKPIIDILPIVKDISKVDLLNQVFEDLSYICMGEYGIAGRRFYWKSKEKRTHHIHLFEQGASEILRHLLFKDFMIAHPDYAQAYSVIKQNLAAVFSQDIENYVNGKSSFVQMIEYKMGTTREKQLNAEDSVIIEPYNTAWPKLAEAEIQSIKTITSPLDYVCIEHLGSTAVPELSSKPIIDIFIMLESISKASHWIKPLETLGYVFWDENPDKFHLRFFKGMPPFGMKRTHHVHIIESANNALEHRVLFRNILRRDEKIRQDYESLKLELSTLYSKDRETYTDKKSKFIENILCTQGYLKPISR
jgi:GrpB-like predicted nucleotidyltransferase (UPF0157 family)